MVTFQRRVRPHDSLQDLHVCLDGGPGLRSLRRVTSRAGVLVAETGEFGALRRKDAVAKLRADVEACAVVDDAGSAWRSDSPPPAQIGNRWRQATDWNRLPPFVTQ